MSDKIKAYSYLFGNEIEFKSLTEACKELKLNYKSMKAYFSRTKAKVWLSQDKTLKIEKI